MIPPVGSTVTIQGASIPPITFLGFGPDDRVDIKDCSIRAGEPPVTLRKVR